MIFDTFRSKIVDFSEQRERMVKTQLARRGLRDERVLNAMREIPREAFVNVRQQQEAYADGPLPIGHGQTISQPFTVAFMAEALCLQGEERVLEIGTGCGYSAAVLSRLAAEVDTIERIPELAEAARERLATLKLDNVHVHTGDGTLGLPEHGPFDAIVVTAGANRLPSAYQEQLGEGGRIVIPIGQTRSGQTMHRYTKRHGELLEENLGMFAFVPLIGEQGWER